MIVRITKMERGTRATKAGGSQTGLWVYGVKLDQYGKDEKNWEKFLPEQFNSEQIGQFEQIGTGVTANVKMVKNGNFWNVGAVSLDAPSTGVAPDSGGGHQQQPINYPQDEPEVSAAATVVPTKPYHKSPKVIRVDALNAAISFTRHMIDLNGQDKMKLYTAKITPALLEDSVLDLARKFENFISGEEASDKMGSDNKDIAKSPVDAEEPVLPDDDVPY